MQHRRGGAVGERAEHRCIEHLGEPAAGREDVEERYRRRYAARARARQARGVGGDRKRLNDAVEGHGKHSCHGQNPWATLLVYVPAASLQSILGPLSWDLCFSTLRLRPPYSKNVGHGGNYPRRFAARAALARSWRCGIGRVVVLLYGSSLVTAGAIALVIAPFALYVALRWPVETVFGLYVVLVPFDNLLNTGSVGTVTKLLGIVAGAFLLLWIARRNLFSFSSQPVRILALLAVWMLATTLWAVDQKIAVAMIGRMAA